MNESSKIVWNIDLSESAKKHFADILQKNSDVSAIRIKIETTGCSGYQYVVRPIVSSSANADSANDDHRFEFVFSDNKIVILIDRKSLALMNGTSIDYEMVGINRKLVFNNPMAVAECGCGESFTVSDQISES